MIWISIHYEKKSKNDFKGVLKMPKAVLRPHSVTTLLSLVAEHVEARGPCSGFRGREVHMLDVLRMYKFSFQLYKNNGNKNFTG